MVCPASVRTSLLAIPSGAEKVRGLGCIFCMPPCRDRTAKSAESRETNRLKEKLGRMEKQKEKGDLFLLFLVFMRK